MAFSQAEFEIKLDWGGQGVNLLTPISEAFIVVDVLSFSTSVEIATSRIAFVYPFLQGRKSARNTPKRSAQKGKKRDWRLN